MAVFLLRGGLPVEVPADYADRPAHRALVDRLNRSTTYADAITILEQHADSFLAADVLTGALWARRFLTTTARLYQLDRPLARRGIRALMAALNGTTPKTGRHRIPPILPRAQDFATAALARWQAEVDAVWPDVAKLVAHIPLSQSHRRALRALLQRQTLRKRDLVLTLTSWETGLPLRRLRSAPTDLVHW